MQYQLDDFQGCLNQPFTLKTEDASYALELIKVDALEQADTVGGRTAFSIVFRGSKDLLLEQSIYHLSNDSLGELDIFIVPIGPDDTGMLFEAVFS